MKKRNYVLDGCFVDDKNKFALIHIYKNASISMRNVLNMRGKYYKWEEIKNKNIITICVIRDPMRRVVSIYQYLLRLEDNGFISKHPTHVTKETHFFKEKDNPIHSFNLFLDYIKDGNFYDAVTLPQTVFLSDRNLTINDIDEVLIQENLNEDFSKFKDKYQIKKDIKKDNESDNETSKLINEFISSDINTQKIIKTIYKDDFFMYNWFIDHGKN